MSSIRDVLIILFKYKHLIVTVFFVIVAAVTTVTFLLTPIYEAKSSILVKFGREYMYRSEVGTLSFQSFNQGEAIRSEIEILTSTGLIKKLIETMGVNILYPDISIGPLQRMTPIQAAALKLEKDISVRNVKKSNVIEVSIQNQNPIVAAKAANLLIEFFREKHLEVLSSPQSSFLEQQKKTYKQKLKGSEDRLEAFKRKHSIYSLDEQRSLLLIQRIELDTSLKTAQNRIQELKHLLFSPHNSAVMISREIPFHVEAERFQLISDAKAKLLALRLKEQGLLVKYMENNRLVINVRKEIQIVKEFIENQENIFIDAEMISLEAKANGLKVQLENQENEIRDIDMREKSLHILRRNVATNEKNYEIYQKKYEEARISEDMDRQKIANISVIQEATAPVKPVKPRMVLNIVLGIILANLVALGFAFMAEYFSQVLSTPERAERRLKLPVLTTISHKNI